MRIISTGRKFRQIVLTTVLVVTAVTVIVAVGFVLERDNADWQRRVQFIDACTSTGGQIFDEAEDKCVTLNPDGTFTLRFTIDQMYRELENVR